MLSSDFNGCKGSCLARHEIYRREVPDNLHIGTRMKIEFLSRECASSTCQRERKKELIGEMLPCCFSGHQVGPRCVCSFGCHTLGTCAKFACTPDHSPSMMASALTEKHLQS